MWRTKVFADESDGSDLNSDGDDVLPAAKRKCTYTNGRRRKALLKSNQVYLVQRVKDLNSDKLSSYATKEVDQQRVMNGGDIERFCKAIDMKALAFLAQHLQEAFGQLFNKCLAEKERYLQFQIWWHKHCSYFLVDKNQQLTLLCLHPEDQ